MGKVYDLYRVKIVFTTVLMIMSGMDYHMINWNLGWDWLGVVWLVLLVRSVDRSETLWYDRCRTVLLELEIHLVNRSIKT
jgi:hypothetical protein